MIGKTFPFVGIPFDLACLSHEDTYPTHSEGFPPFSLCFQAYNPSERILYSTISFLASLLHFLMCPAKEIRC